MLDWMKGNEGQEAADTSKVLEPPETPAAMFAMRAFKSALFGTPGAEDDEQTPRPAQSKESTHQRGKIETITNPVPIPEKLEPKPELDPAANPSGSPTKSILVTPGTISNRRKTVSFGEGVVDNEGKRDSHSIKVVKTPPNPSGNLSTQWMSGSADGKPRSKLTQTLMDARDNATKNADSGKSTETSASPRDDSAAPAQAKNESEPDDITLNLDEPRSESGKYWKTEFDNYRVRTNREIKKLIHYRTIAKSYARKKDSEALRLAEKLKEEEEKVAEMERQVSRLASSIVGQGSKVDKEQLIQDLTKQTALALQYKQQVTSLRASLEQQGVVGGEMTKESDPAKLEEPEDLSPEPSLNELHKAQQKLKEANAKIEEMKRQNTDLSTLQNLAESSEKKAQELEKENNSLKQTLARVKQEMSRYEGRRKEKENKLKQRESKLEARIQEYRERLKTTTQEHRQSEDDLRKGFDDERRRMQAQIDQLKTRVSAVERAPTLRRPQERRSLSPRKEYTGVQVHDFAGQDHDHPTIDEEATEDIEGPPSPSPRSKAREARHMRNATTGALDLKRTSRDIQDLTADDAQVKEYLAEVLHRPILRTRHTALDQDPAPPSSPPEIESFKSLGRGNSKYHPAGDNQRTYRSLYLRGSELTDTDANTQPTHANTHRPRTHIKSTLDTLSGQTTSRVGNYAGHTISGGERPGKRYGLLANLKTESLSPERVAAAKSRLRQKRESQRLRPSGKENF